MGAYASRERRRFAIHASELTHASLAASALPSLTEAANGNPIRTGEYRIVKLLSLHTRGQQVVESIGHEYLSPLVVLGRSWGQTDDALHEVHLVDFHSDQLRDAPAERATALNQRAKPKIRAIN
jgi:hypothetical protein